MNNQRSVRLSFIIFLLFSILSFIGITLIIVLYNNIIYQNNFFSIMFIFWVCIIIASISIYEFYSKLILNYNKTKSLEENIKEFYQHQNLEQSSNVEMYN